MSILIVLGAFGLAYLIAVVVFGHCPRRRG